MVVAVGWGGGGGWEWLAGWGKGGGGNGWPAGGRGGGGESSNINLTQIGDSMERVTRLDPISEKDVTRRTVGFSTYNCER
jgi:hypothetical protein